MAYYGLAAAGVICLALLSGTNADHNLSTRPSIWIQDLSVLVAELEPGAFLQREDPNYALLSDAACTIQNLLNCLLANKFDVRHTGPNEEANHMNFNLSDGDLMWNPQGFQEFDPSFWLSLSEHPFLTLPEDSATAF